MDLVKIILQYFLLPALSAIFTYWFMRYKAKASKNDLHDKSVFDRIDSIINSQDVAGIIHNARMGYLYMSAHSQSDDLHDFNQDMANRFIDVKLQKGYSDFDDSLARLSRLYALSSFADFTDGSRKCVKLVYHKRGNIDFAEDRLIVENEELVSKVEKAYSIFRSIIKRRFSV
jgi:hypothetical protein